MAKRVDSEEEWRYLNSHYGCNNLFFFVAIEAKVVRNTSTVIHPVFKGLKILRDTFSSIGEYTYKIQLNAINNLFVLFKTYHDRDKQVVVTGEADSAASWLLEDKH